jgi:hypothetical protein
MFARKADVPPAFHVPAPAADRPSWVKVGVIAAVGFAVGILWPRVTGLKLGPNAPEPGAHASAAAKSADPATSAPSAMLTAPPLPPPIASSTPTATSNAPTITFGHGFVLSCKTKDGDTQKGAACGQVGGFEGLAQPRLKKLSQCPAADGVSGKLAVVLTVDFGSSHIGVDTGKQTTIASPDGLYACMRAAFQGAPIGGLEHEHQRYSILYTLTLAAPGGAAAAASAAASAVAGDSKEATVSWETALVRDAPRNGQIVARLPRGTKLQLGPAKDGWYPVKFGADFASDGWVYRGAIGK